MKRRQYSVEHIVSALKYADLRIPVADLSRQSGISEQTCCRGREQYAGLESNQVRVLEPLQAENFRRKKLQAAFGLDMTILPDIATNKALSPR